MFLSFLIQLKLTELLVFEDELYCMLQVILLVIFLVIADGPKETNKEKTIGGWDNFSSIIHAIRIWILRIFISKDILSSKYIRYRKIQNLLLA